METILEGGTPAPAPNAAPSGFEALATDPVAASAPTPAEAVTNPAIRAPIVGLGETNEPLSDVEAAPLEAGFMESFAAEPPLETAKGPKAPITNEIEIEIDPEGIEKLLRDD